MLLRISFLVLFSSMLSSAITVPGRLTNEYQTTHGTILEGQIPIKNNGTTKELVRVILNDYRFDSSGNNFFEEPGTHERSNGKWITFGVNQELIEIPPGETFSLSYKIHVPNDPTLNGTYWSIAFIEPVIVPKELDPNGKAQVGITTVVRYAIQLITNFESGAEPELNITDAKSETLNDKKFYCLNVENTGTTLVQPQSNLELYNNDGSRAHNIKGPKFRLYPGCSAKYMIPIEDVVEGTYHSLVIFDGGSNALFGSEGNITVQRKKLIYFS